MIGLRCKCNGCFYWQEGFCSKKVPALDMNGSCIQLMKYGFSTQFAHSEDKESLNILNIVKNKTGEDKKEEGV